jgi:vitamin B12 transporter
VSRIAFLYFVLSFTTSLLLAQLSSMTLTGEVLDPTGALIPHANVRLLDAAGHEVGHTLTDQNGSFRFERVSVNSRVVEASLLGFETTRVSAEAGSHMRLVLTSAPVRENIVVTATRTETPTSQTGTETSVLTEQEIRERHQLLVSTLLSSLPSVAVVRSGGLGNVTSVFVRGGESNFNKVLLDGIPLNEPGGTFEFSNLAAEDLERIEVVRGPQSALFGSDAMASTIQLFTRRAQLSGGRPHVSLSFEGGKFQTLHGQANVNGRTALFDYALGGAWLETQNQEPNNAFTNRSLSGNFGAMLGKSTTARLILRADLGRVGTPGQTAFERPDSDANFHKADGYIGFTVRNQTSANWEQRVSYTFARTRQVSRDLFLDPPYTPTFEGHTAPFQFSDFLFDFLNDAWRQHLGYQSDFSLESSGRTIGQNLFTVALDWDRERGFIDDRLSGTTPTRARRDNFGGTFQHQALGERFTLSNGVRVEDNGSFGRAIVPRTSASYLMRRGADRLGATRFKFNFGLGINEPTFIESFSPSPSFQGNPDLRPERARSFDVGAEQRFWDDRLKLELNAFSNRFRDLIAFRTTSFSPFRGSFFNIAQSRADGLELVAEAAPRRGLQIRGNYTLLDSKIEKSSQPTSPVFKQGQELFRRPRHSGSLLLSWGRGRFTLTSSTLYVGRRVDSDFSSLQPPIISNPAYTKWDLGWNFRGQENVSYFAAVENFLNQHYMEALGYPALGISFRTGARVSF